MFSTKNKFRPHDCTEMVPVVNTQKSKVAHSCERIGACTEVPEDTQNARGAALATRKPMAAHTRLLSQRAEIRAAVTRPGLNFPCSGPIPNTPPTVVGKPQWLDKKNRRRSQARNPKLTHAAEGSTENCSKREPPTCIIHH